MTNMPYHGYRGDTLTPPPMPKPRGITVAIARQAGGRAHDIARAVGERLGWQVYDPESLDHLANDPLARDELLADLPPGAIEWADIRLGMLLSQRKLVESSLAAETARLLFALGARGEAVVIGRGAGYVLPPETTLHVRIVSPREERIALLADWMRLPPAEAEQQIHARDGARNKLLTEFLDGDPEDPLRFDMVLNSTRLGLDTCTTLIVQAAAAKTSRPDEPAFDPI